jgi:capsular polysaccharide biosynthesis protein
VVALVVGVVALYVGYEFYHEHKIANLLTTYSSNVTVQIGVQTQGEPANVAVNTATAEAFADTLASGPIFASKEFDTQVSNQVAADTAEITQQYGAHPDLGNWQNASAIGTAISATRIHALVTITVTWSTPAGAWAIANAVGETLSANVSQYFNYSLSSSTPTTSTGTPVKSVAVARVISSATAPNTISGTSGKTVELLLLLLVALVAGIALAFLVDYLDDRIRSKDEVTNLLQLPIYGEVPRPPTPGRANPPRSTDNSRSPAA